MLSSARSDPRSTELPWPDPLAACQICAWVASSLERLRLHQLHALRQVLVSLRGTCTEAWRFYPGVLA
jgi:hypothetical protein